MQHKPIPSIRLDVLGLFLAGLINTFLAPIFAMIIFGPGTEARQPDLYLRIEWSPPGWPPPLALTGDWPGVDRCCCRFSWGAG